MEPVQPLVAATEPARAAEIGVHDDARDIVGRDPAGVPLDPGVLEAMCGVTGLEDLPRRPRCDDVIGHADVHQSVSEEATKGCPG